MILQYVSLWELTIFDSEESQIMLRTGLIPKDSQSVMFPGERGSWKASSWRVHLVVRRIMLRSVMVGKGNMLAVFPWLGQKAYSC